MLANRRLAPGLIPLLLIAAALACSSPIPVSPVVTSSPTPEPAATESAPSPVPAAKLDLSHRPQIWFGPLDPAPPNADRPYSGALDYFDLFEPDAPWEQAA